MRFVRQILTITQLLLISALAQAEFDHSQWDALLGEYVVVLQEGKVTQVDYGALSQHQADLQNYLASIAEVSRAEFDAWVLPEQLAFLINAYNAWTVQLILSEYPGIDSIRDIGFLPGAPWRREIVSLFGEQVSLDELEHGMIRGWGRYDEPRIHFAVNCAAIGCPALRPEAYVADRLDQQLQESTSLFLADRARNYFESDRIYISRIFDWYEEDFEQGWQGFTSVAQFLTAYSEALELTSAQQSAVLSGAAKIRYTRYDWDLNKAD